MVRLRTRKLPPGKTAYRWQLVLEQEDRKEVVYAAKTKPKLKLVEEGAIVALRFLGEQIELPKE